MVTTIIVGLWVLFLLLFAWKFKFFKGRFYGNKVAAHIGIPKNLFHTLLDKTPMPSLLWLAHLKETGTSLEDTATVLSPYMRVRLYALEDSFGPQPMLEEAKPVVERLYRQYQVMQQSANN